MTVMIQDLRASIRGILPLLASAVVAGMAIGANVAFGLSVVVYLIYR